MTDRQTETDPAKAAQAISNAWAQALRDEGKADRTVLTPTPQTWSGSWTATAARSHVLTGCRRRRQRKATPWNNLAWVWSGQAVIEVRAGHETRLLRDMVST